MDTQTTNNTASSGSTTDSIKGKTFTGVGNLIRPLPTGTVFLYQFLSPILTNNGRCSTTDKYVSSVLIALCGLSCFLSTFTDSYRDDQGNIHYGIATFKGFWPFSGTSSSVDFKSYRLQTGDFVHATLSLIVFSVISLLASDTVKCFYPSFEYTQKGLLMALPPVIGSVATSVFVAFPNKRHGIGYPSHSSSSSTPSTSSAVQPSNAVQTRVANESSHSGTGTSSAVQPSDAKQIRVANKSSRSLVVTPSAVQPSNAEQTRAINESILSQVAQERLEFELRIKFELD